MTKRKIIIIHSIVFLALSLLLFFSSEGILRRFAREIYDVVLWLNLIIYGTIGVLILTTFSCLVFLKQRKIVGAFIILVNLLWLWFNSDLLYRYHFTEFYPTFRIADWVLIVSAVLAIIGIVIGYKAATDKLRLKLAVLIDFVIIIIGIVLFQL